MNPWYQLAADLSKLPPKDFDAQIARLKREIRELQHYKRTEQSKA